MEHAVGYLQWDSFHKGVKEMPRMTPAMIRVEEQYKRPLERLLPEMVNERGLTGTALEFGVSKATIGYWLLKLGIQVRRVALAPDETLEIKHQSR